MTVYFKIGVNITYIRPIKDGVKFLVWSWMRSKPKDFSYDFYQ